MKRRCIYYGDPRAERLVLQPLGEHELEYLEVQLEEMQKAAKEPFYYVGFLIEDWNQELSPWEAPPAFGDSYFGAGAVDTLSYVEKELLAELQKDVEYKKIFLGGYSLAGLFALWAAYETDTFAGVAGVSPSVWIKGWKAYAGKHNCLAKKVYLSLGDKEDKTKNQFLRTTGEIIRWQEQQLQESVQVKLRFHPGNHFTTPHLRVAEGFAWLLSEA